MKPIDLKEVCDSPRMTVLHIRLKNGVETDTSATYPQCEAASCFYLPKLREPAYGVLVRMKPKARKRVLYTKGNPVAFRERERAEKIARWLNDPGGTRDEWDREQGTQKTEE